MYFNLQIIDVLLQKPQQLLKSCLIQRTVDKASLLIDKCCKIENVYFSNVAKLEIFFCQMLQNWNFLFVKCDKIENIYLSNVAKLEIFTTLYVRWIQIPGDLYFARAISQIGQHNYWHCTPSSFLTVFVYCIVYLYLYLCFVFCTGHLSDCATQLLHCIIFCNCICLLYCFLFVYVFMFCILHRPSLRLGNTTIAQHHLL